MISELIMIAALAQTPADNGAREERPEATELQLAQGAISEDEAASIARQQTGGRVLGVQWSESGGQPVYVVRVLVDGSIREVLIPAGGR